MFLGPFAEAAEHTTLQKVVPYERQGRVFGFARDILLARVLGAGGVADAWQLAFQLPNLFRRLFAEGAFASAFVPLFNRHMAETVLATARLWGLYPPPRTQPQRLRFAISY